MPSPTIVQASSTIVDIEPEAGRDARRYERFGRPTSVRMPDEGGWQPPLRGRPRSLLQVPCSLPRYQSATAPSSWKRRGLSDSW